MNILETQNLTKFYGKNRGVEDVSISVNEGEVFGFIGPNGSGKSTTIRLLLNLIFPTSGSGKIFGQDIVSNSKSIMQNVGYLPGEVRYYGEMTARELLEYHMAYYGVEPNERYREICDRFQVEMGKRIDEMSMGNQKKVAIAQSFVHQPKLLIMDEPTNGLDPLMQSRFVQTVREERERGTTVFFSSHILGDVQRLSERVAIIREGKIVDVQSMADLRSKQLKKCRLVVDSNRSIDRLKQLDGVSDVQTDANNVSFTFKGDYDQLIGVLDKYNLEDVVIEDPSLEEIFMHYYE